MPTFTWKGWTQAEIKTRLEAHMKQVAPPTFRGVDDPYRADKLDDDDVKDAKKAAHKAWMDRSKKEYAEGLKAESDKQVFQRAQRSGGKNTKPIIIETITFEKDKPVTLSDAHWLSIKLKKLCEGGKFPPDPHWEMGDKPAPKPEPTPKPATKAKE